MIIINELLTSRSLIIVDKNARITTSCCRRGKLDSFAIDAANVTSTFTGAAHFRPSRMFRYRYWYWNHQRKRNIGPFESNIVIMAATSEENKCLVLFLLRAICVCVCAIQPLLLRFILILLTSSCSSICTCVCVCNIINCRHLQVS